MHPPTKISRFRLSQVAEDPEQRTYLTEPDPYGYRPLADNIPHLVEDGDDLWTIAGKHYATILGGETLFWVIADFQPEPIADPTIALVAGTTIVVPSPRTVREEILSDARRAPGVRYAG